MKLRSMHYAGVTLEKGVCRDQFQDIQRFLLDLDNDRMLYLFRKGAGFDIGGTTYYGWYGIGATTFGQWIAAMARIFHLTGDTRFRDKMTLLLDEWRKCLLEDGYTDFSPEHKSTYGFEKVAGGLVEAFEFGGYRDALDLLETITRWADKRFDHDIRRDYATYAYLAQRRMHEWYTLGEVYYRAWELSGNSLFLDFARTWDYDLFWKDMAEGKDDLPPLHAYSHVNSLCGAAQKCLQTGDPGLLRTLTSAYDLLTERHTYATGGYGPSEVLFGKPGYLGDALFSPREREMMHMDRFEDLEGLSTVDDTWGSCEVSCCSWAVFKLTVYLLCLTGEARYAQWAEQLIVNGTMAQLPLSPDGKVEYYANYFRHGARKDVEDRRIGGEGSANVWQCCTGTFPQAVTAYHELVFFPSEDGVAVAQYIPSSARLILGGKTVRVTVCGDYPMEQESRIRLTLPEGEAAFTLRLRIPAWARDARVLVNGEAADIPAVPGQWAVLDRTWQDGDTVTLCFPYHLAWKSVDAQHPDLCALTWGPMVLACDEILELKGDREHPEDWLKPVPGQPGVFETLPGHDKAWETRTHVFRPFWSLPDTRWYYMHVQFAG